MSRHKLDPQRIREVEAAAAWTVQVLPTRQALSESPTGLAMKSIKRAAVALEQSTEMFSALHWM